MEERVFAKSVERKIGTSISRVDIHKDEHYYHPTYFIKNLEEYIHFISTISSINDSSIYSKTIIYRGLPDHEYELCPGLSRYKKIESETESLLINAFLTKRPDAFNGLTEFDTIAKMQHYGLPTRLLDFTSNPLVALYFACESDRGKNGRVVCHNNFLQNDSSSLVKIICKKVMDCSYDANYTVDGYYCDESFSLRKYMIEVYFSGMPTVIRPKYWNQRISNQAGVFMFFPNELNDRYRYILIHANELGVEGAMREYGRGWVDKKIISKALEYEPVDLYMSLNNSVVTNDIINKMYESYCKINKEEFWENIRDRFQVDYRLKKISSEEIKNDFCSVIIEARNKKKILKELSNIGIGADFIYPELEYSAKEVKRRFGLQ